MGLTACDNVRQIAEVVSSNEKWLLDVLRATPFGKVVVTMRAGEIVTTEKQETLQPPHK